MLRPDRLGLVGCLLIFALSFVFQDSDSSGRHTPSPESWEPRRPEISDIPEQRRPRNVGPKQTLPEISSRDPTLKLMPSVKGNSTGTAFSIGKGVWMAVIQTPFPMENAVPVLFPFADGISFNVGSLLEISGRVCFGPTLLGRLCSRVSLISGRRGSHLSGDGVCLPELSLS